MFRIVLIESISERFSLTSGPLIRVLSLGADGVSAIGPLPAKAIVLAVPRGFPRRNVKDSVTENLARR
jgi:hypothetical protein